jgi:hypothetical protein
MLFGVTLIMSLNFTGFCYPEMRYYGNQELLEIAINVNLKWHDPKAERSKIYKSLEEFKTINPNCCILFKWGHHFADPIVFRFFGFYQSVAEIWYRVKDSGPQEFYSSYIFMNACGKVVQYWGTPESRGPSQQRDKGG